MAASTTTGMRWAVPQSLGGRFAGEVGVASHADGRLHVFHRGEDGTLRSSWQNRDLSWTRDRELVPEARTAGSPAAVRGRDGRIHVCWRDGENRLMRVRQHEVNGAFGPPAPLTTGLNSDPVLTLNANGRISVFYTGIEGSLWEARQSGLDSYDWNTPVSLGGWARGRPAAARAGDGRVSVVHIGRDDEAWANTQKGPDATEWEGFARVAGGVRDGLHVLPDCNGHLDVHYRGERGESRWFGQVTGYGGFSTTTYGLNEHLVGTPRSALACDGRQHVFARGAHGRLLTAAQQRPGSLEYGEFAELTSGADDDPVPALGRDGRLFVFYRGEDGALWYVNQEFG
ncbi:hypothetical protein [Streptomyces sp. NPDC048172]|uniref:hypothetical protein n=1 Tax=Streptomyces sp. NPDC048172 TaxID=3365505 RepID=UPI0037246900